MIFFLEKEKYKQAISGSGHFLQIYMGVLKGPARRIYTNVDKKTKDLTMTTWVFILNSRAAKKLFTATVTQFLEFPNGNQISS